jgi:hypothetical protein
MKTGFICKLVASAALLSLNTAQATNVPGTSDPWLGGMPNGSVASSGDSAPAESPVLISGITAGSTYTFTVSGSVNNAPGPSGLGPDGGIFYPHFDGAQNGIATLINAPINSLIGVFLDSTQPDLSGAPGGLDFSTLGVDFSVLSPELKQPFFIGDGMTSSSMIQQFIAPPGATRLVLGTMDGFGWYNNDGSFDVNVNVNGVPDGGATLAFLGIGLFGLAGLRRKV